MKGKGRNGDRGIQLKTYQNTIFERTQGSEYPIKKINKSQYINLIKNNKNPLNSFQPILAYLWIPNFTDKEAYTKILAISPPTKFRICRKTLSSVTHVKFWLLTLQWQVSTS